MKPVEIVILIVAVAVVISAVVGWAIRRRRKKGRCGGDCSHCTDCPYADR